MPNVKRITFDYGVKGKTVYAIIRREADNFLLDDADGAFGAAPIDYFRTLSENATIRGRYEVDENRTTWNNGKYTIAAYDQVGGSPSPLADTMMGTAAMFIYSDAEFTHELIPGTQMDLVNAPNATAITAIQGGLATATTLTLVKTNTDKLTFNASNFIKSVQQFPGGSIVADAGNSNLQFKTDLADTINDTWKRAWIKFTSGTLINQVDRISAYNGTTKFITVSSGFSGSPTAADTFVLIDE